MAPRNSHVLGMNPSKAKQVVPDTGLRSRKGLGASYGMGYFKTLCFWPRKASMSV